MAVGLAAARRRSAALERVMPTESESTRWDALWRRHEAALAAVRATRAAAAQP